MKKTEFLRSGDTIGITAPSDGNVKETDFVRLENGKLNLEERGYRVVETPDVRRSERGRSADGAVRAKEFMGLVEDPEVAWIVAAKGGDFLLEMLPHLDFDVIRRNPKWIQGYSDNTGILFPVTTLCDIPTVYGCNFNDFGMAEWHPAVAQNLEILEGKREQQRSFPFYEAEFVDRVTGLEGYDAREPACLRLVCGGMQEGNVADGARKCATGQQAEAAGQHTTPRQVDCASQMPGEAAPEARISGRVLGGCLDVLLNLVGTRFDGTKEFNRRYRKEGVLWYLETFALSAERVAMGLWQLRQAGWFDQARGFVFGRPCFFQSDYGYSFEEAVEGALGDLGVPVVTGADIGHRAPQMTMLNGIPAEFIYQEGKGRLSYGLAGAFENR